MPPTMAEEDSHTAVKAVDNSEHSSISSEHPSKGDDEAIVEAGDNPDSVESDSVEETLASKEQKPYPPSSQQQHQQAAHGDEDSKEENLEEGEPDYGDLEEFPADPGLGRPRGPPTKPVGAGHRPTRPIR